MPRNLSRVGWTLLLLVLCVGSAWGQAYTQSPFEFPLGGVTRAARNVVTVASGGGRVTADSVAVGNSGVIRGITLINTSTDSTTAGQYWLTVTYDGNAAATDSFPIASLVAMDNPRGNMVDSTHTFATPFWERRTAWTSPTQTNGIHWRLAFPIPYTNGCVVRLYNWGAGSAALWVEVSRQTQLPACWNRTYRFHVSRTDSTLAAAANVPGTGTRKVWFSAAGQGHGSNTAVTANHVGWAFIGVAGAGATPWNKEIVLTGRTADTLFTVSTPDLDVLNSQAQKTSPALVRPEVFFRRSAGKVGFVAQATLALLSQNNSCLEACPRWYTDNANAGSDGQTPEITSTGTEDFFGGVGYGFAGVGGVVGTPGPTAGCSVYTDSNDWGAGAVCTLYRAFRNDPIAYTNGCSATFANWNTATTRCIWTVVYYERQ